MTTTESRRRSASRPAVRLAAAVALASVAVGCRSSEKLSPAEVYEKNLSIFRRLSSYDEAERKEAINQILALGKARGAEVVAWVLDEKDVFDNDRLRVNLAGILAVWEDPRGIPYLLELMHSRDDGFRRIVQEGLMAYGARRDLIEALDAKLDDPAVRVRRISAAVLSRMGTHESMEVLGKNLRDEDPDVRFLCLDGIDKGPRSPKRTEYLIDALTDPDPDLRAHAWKILKNDRENAPPKLVQFDPEGSVRDRAQAIAVLRRWAGVKD